MKISENAIIPVGPFKGMTFQEFREKRITVEQMREKFREEARLEHEQRIAELEAKYPEFAEIKLRLLAVGGDTVETADGHPVYPRLAALHACGQIWTGDQARSRRGLKQQCHWNTANNWVRSKGQLRIATGYALSDCGMWYAHSWNLDENGTIIESTSAWDAYYGVVLEGDQEELMFFLDRIVPEHLAEYVSTVSRPQAVTLLKKLARTSVPDEGAGSEGWTGGMQFAQLAIRTNIPEVYNA